MDDAAIVTIVSGVVTVVTMVVGWLTLWVKLKYAAKDARDAADKAETAAVKAAGVEAKLDDNTALTEDVARAINGHEHGKTKLEKLEDYAHESRHGLAGAIHALSLKMDAVLLTLNRLDSRPDR